jgi:hypothetical protein
MRLTHRELGILDDLGVHLTGQAHLGRQDRGELLAIDARGFVEHDGLGRLGQGLEQALHAFEGVGHAGGHRSDGPALGIHAGKVQSLFGDINADKVFHV